MTVRRSACLHQDNRLDATHSTHALISVLPSLVMSQRCVVDPFAAQSSDFGEKASRVSSNPSEKPFLSGSLRYRELCGIQIPVNTVWSKLS